jgi:chorismate mutase/prephenate dehydratase
MSEPRSQQPMPRDAASVEAEAELQRLREAIDAVDRDLLAALNRRAELVREVGRVKQRERLPVYGAARERDLVAALVAANPGPFPSAAIPGVFREIVSATRSLEARLRVAFLGPEGTFSHAAVRECFGAQVELVPLGAFAEALVAVERGQADLALLPIENTTEGVVTAALDALLDCELPLCGETQLRISHSLLSQSGRMEDVKRVASHPQPLAQCRSWLERQLPGVPRVEVASTAAAAALAREDAEVAAIGSALLAEDGRLRVAASHIEDRRDNTTRFVLVGGSPPPPSGNDLTSLAYTVRKAESGALYRLLEPFAENGVNLTSIQARPLKGTPWEYVFFLDLEGHISDERVRRAVEAAGRRANSYRVLGSFPRSLAARPRAEGA